MEEGEKRERYKSKLEDAGHGKGLAWWMVTDAKSIRPAKKPGLNVMAGDADLCTMETTSLSPSLSMLPAEARVWVYKSAVAFTPDQAKAIKEQGAVFTGSWMSHGDGCSASTVLHDHFVADRLPT